jgi:hypothetical protein
LTEIDEELDFAYVPIGLPTADLGREEANDFLNRRRQRSRSWIGVLGHFAASGRRQCRRAGVVALAVKLRIVIQLHHPIEEMSRVEATPP